MAIKGSALRIGGLNSGLDTEAIVNAMTASTKLRITTNQRKVLKLQAQQEAYRSIIDKFNGLKDKYFSPLSNNTWLRSRSTFNRHSATVTGANGTEGAPKGISVSTNANAMAGDYKVTVNQAASQTSVSSKSMDSLNIGDIDLSQISGGANTGKTFLINVTSGGSTKQIVFEGGADEAETIDNINQQLIKAFGSTNDTATTGKGIVFVDNAGGMLKFGATDRRSISTSPVTEMKDSIAFSLAKEWETGNNSVTLIIDGHERNVSFQTLAKEYFEGFNIVEKDGKWAVEAKTATIADLTDEERAMTPAQQDALLKDIQKEYDSRVSVLNDILSDMYNAERFAAYQDWQKHGDYNADFRTTTLTSDQRVNVLKSAALGLDTTDLDTALADINRADFEDGENGDAAFETARLKAVADFVGKLEGDDRTNAVKALDDRLLTEIKNSMSTEQRALFDAEVKRITDNNAQKDYDNAVTKAYNEFWKWQQSQGSKMGDNNWIAINEFKEMFNIPDNVPAGTDWKDVIPSNSLEWGTAVQNYYADKTAEGNSKISDINLEIGKLDPEDDKEKIAELEAEIKNIQSTIDRNKTVSDFWNGKDFADAVEVTQKVFIEAQERFEDNPVNELTFIRGAYNEQEAFNTRYSAEGAVNGKTLNQFVGEVAGKLLSDPNFSTENFAHHFNKSTIERVLGNVTFSDGTRIEPIVTTNDKGEVTGVELKAYTLAVDADGKPLLDADGERVKDYKNIGAFVNSDSTNDFGLVEAKSTANTVSTSTRIGTLGLDADENGDYNIEINGVKFSFGENTTISQMMSTINSNSAAGVTMTFSTLTNSFEIKTREFGTDSSITIKGDSEGLFGKLGFEEFVSPVDGDDLVIRNGQNLVLTINDETIETNSNSYEFNGTVINVDPTVETGTEFEISVRRDTSQMYDLIKQFVDDYNDLIDFVYGFVGQKPDNEYYFLTDADREELNLSEVQEKKWEDKARQGLLYNDRTLIDIMGKMRTAMFSGVPRGDGTSFGLFSMGINTSSNWRDNGKLKITEDELKAAIENNIDMIAELFTNTEKGLMPQLDEVIKSAVNTTGARADRGSLIQKAGMANMSSTNDNAIHDQIKRLNDMISTLQMRYDKQQDRFWRIFSALETQMGQLNSQSDYISQFMGNMNG
ncbi:MAG: flagellar filament capping protein FliD [Oscillospiraceae bacterium]|nr:flagellar filament capping protein FliD [Oscillospiraceae bacterium]